MILGERFEAEELHNHGLSELDSAIEARRTTLNIIHRATGAEREALLAWADRDARSVGLSSISAQYKRWLATGGEI
jgi:hypothetical protein